ncbi:MAG: hypothetical protein ACKVZ0_00815 [Gemmatimonadales bacterium]
MRGRLTSSFGFAWVVLLSTAVAQTEPTPPAPHPCDSRSGPTKTVCRAGYDAITVMTPLAALAAGGGNPSLGSAAGGERFGQVWLTLRGSYLVAVLPHSGYDGTGDTVPAAQRLPVAVPSLDLRFTLLRKPLAVGAVSMDFLGTVTGVPRGATRLVRFGDDVRSVGGVALGFGYGLRIGMAAKAPLPTASLNIARHDMPRFSYGAIAAGSNFAYALSASAINVRLLAGRRFGAFELTAGGGVDLIKGDYSLVLVDQATKAPLPRADSTFSTMRIMTLANGAINLGKSFRLSFEGGFQVGKDEKLPTLFDGLNTKSGRFFGGVGLGFKL